MSLFEVEVDSEFTFKQLLSEAKHWNVDILKYKNIKDKEIGAVVVLSGPNTKAYLQALERKQELLSEDEDLDDWGLDQK